MIIAGIGGKVYMDKEKQEVSIKQQKNVATWIVRSYDVSEITFLKVTRDKITNSITLYFKLNNQDKYKTGITVNNLKEFDNTKGLVGLNPISKFENLKKENSKPDDIVDLQKIKIKYIEEKNDD